MRAVLPGKPQAKLQAICTGQWEGQRLIVYISGNALVILGGAHKLLQTIYQDEVEDLEAVALDETSGKIATCSGSAIYVHRPYGKNEGALRWSLQCSLKLDIQNDATSTLSWGTSEELLVGSSCLTLFATADAEAAIWRRKLANPAKFAHFSYDASLIASTGRYDRLMKIWRRLSFGSDDVRFDYTYLPHPATVTGLHWRRPYHREQIVDNVLYTIAADRKVRIWAATDTHGLQILQLWAEIDMLESIKPRRFDLVKQSNRRYAFIIDSRDFIVATENAVQSCASEGKEHHALEHVIEVANRSPEICVVLDDGGHMSAWGLEKVGCKARKTTNIFNVAHIEGFQFPLPLDAESGYVQVYNFCSDRPGSPLTLLVHHFDGIVEWVECRVDELFDPSPRQQRLTLKAMWSGHDRPIKKIVRNASGEALISRTNDNEGLIWIHSRSSTGTKLMRQSFLSTSEHIHRTCLLQEGDFVVTLHHQSISLWDTRGSTAVQLASCAYQLDGKALCLILLPETDDGQKVIHVATIGSKMKGIVWEVWNPTEISTNSAKKDSRASSIEQYCTFNLGLKDDLAFVLPVDPAGSSTAISGFIDVFARDIAMSYTNGGILHFWTAKTDLEKGHVQWLLTSTVETGIERPSLASGSSTRKAALVGAAKTTLTIWDTRNAQLEYQEEFDSQDMIQDLDWTSTPDQQSILAVGFPRRVLLLSQLRYDYLNAGPAWASIREIRIGDLTPHQIGDSIWLGSGNLVVGAGNQLFVYDKRVKVPSSLVPKLRLPSQQNISKDIFNVVSRLNGPLPVFHPQFLAQCILSGKNTLVHKIIVGLNKTLKFFAEGDKVDSFLEIPVDEFLHEQEIISVASHKEMRSPYADFSDSDEAEVVTEDLAAQLNENLAKTSIPQLSSQEQIHLADIVECVATVEKHRRSMDENAARYLLFFRQHVLRKGQAPFGQVGITWREIVWAFHSGSQEILVDLVSRQFQGKVLWEHARESGIFMWMTDLTALRAQFEMIARNEYTKTDEKNPIDCSLYYLALKKKNVLVGLWRMAAWNREQASTQRLLANNFQESRWKTAALKNAYALLGKRRFEYAAAFFLLAGNLKDAVNVCFHQLRDVQLAIAIARVHEGDDGLVLQGLLEEKVLPQAAVDGNRWLATWAFWMLNRRDRAVRALISPIFTLLENPESPRLQARSYLANDPALVILYKQLRGKTLQTLKGASMIAPRAEWGFITQNARLYDRMGCDLLALDLVRNWEFLQQPLKTKELDTSPPDPRKMLRRRSSLVVADLPGPKLPNEMKPGVMGDRPPRVFEEPDANSLLDSFGF
ncbi:MAG: regulator of (H+)-ATPase in vacuolar membrane [Pleopsidium flavum]|nr:MAG: regulator of (H+)-ATPase in vacuolar membrane [Pleopsidium flavum]